MLRLSVASTITLLVALANSAKVWDGSFNNYESPADFDKWSWANQVGTYQWYIHGSEETAHYLDVSPDYKNPALTSEERGLRSTIDSGATWNGQTMARTELIPQTTSDLGSGNLFYHFSVMRSDTNTPDSTQEHQLKYGVGANPTDLQWHVGGVQQWATDFTANTWFNFAYDIDFSAKTVGLWASTGSDPLTKVVENVAANTFTNSADWHLGVLRVIANGVTEDWYFSGVYVEDGEITTSIA
uniref:Glycoside hydrolase 131 catalytic N-terminal domain-containing protein n=1 Tax=Moniliophthora roreri TaxID=221103 RepID=A0A0W0FJF0_MONRR